MTTEGKLKVLFFSFFEAAYVQVVEWWFKNEMPYPPHVMEVQIEILLEGNLVFPTITFYNQIKTSCQIGS
ncbi:TetR family transcriptional regulator C-terminal domain-containing protein [Bacillus atrophaeus]|nr:TetR family transcriptional regulator C-terminal domain-containing protein [Bacillus atrophaeus]MCY8527301.1 TetR family transcriptional regulator C-terminal domain-containing protein [Bacillus atrophaeus]